MTEQQQIAEALRRQRSELADAAGCEACLPYSARNVLMRECERLERLAKWVESADVVAKVCGVTAVPLTVNEPFPTLAIGAEVDGWRYLGGWHFTRGSKTPAELPRCLVDGPEIAFRYPGETKWRRAGAYGKVHYTFHEFKRV